MGATSVVRGALKQYYSIYLYTRTVIIRFTSHIFDVRSSSIRSGFAAGLHPSTDFVRPTLQVSSGGGLPGIVVCTAAPW